ncbi:MAG TPA: SEC-C metal-binding domain-containing protein [Thermoanaerobaculia bacterium]
MDPYLRERIENWASDFCASPRFAEVKGAVREHAANVLVAFLSRACESRGKDPGEVEEPDVKAGLLEGVGGLALPEAARDGVPLLLALFLEEMQQEGRIAGGRALGLFAKALREPYLEAAGGKKKPYRAPAAAIGRNDPCPCGSGKKYKKCCLGRL